mgnify:CR=1 FL=1|mmetsp:Transcript_18432/g.55564  ORF Transcript_18432/g.55564 Transcript_18432/m.55564 type:complete len:222 (-) Transcript_18432:1408-2073(-)|eukprot:scaffold5422_cov36-Tisochrysis_lutea.AAC.5
MSVNARQLSARRVNTYVNTPVGQRSKHGKRVPSTWSTSRRILQRKREGWPPANSKMAHVIAKRPVRLPFACVTKPAVPIAALAVSAGAVAASAGAVAVSAGAMAKAVAAARKLRAVAEHADVAQEAVGVPRLAAASVRLASWRHHALTVCDYATLSQCQHFGAQRWVRMSCSHGRLTPSWRERTYPCWRGTSWPCWRGRPRPFWPERMPQCWAGTQPYSGI